MVSSCFNPVPYEITPPWLGTQKLKNSNFLNQSVFPHLPGEGGDFI